MGLFLPDIFSKPNPVFKPVAPSMALEPMHILKEYYSFGSQDVLSIEKLEGLEINSQNFRIATKGKTYALKRVSAQAKIDSCRIQLFVAQELSKQGIALPHLVEASNGQPYVCNDNSQLWILSDFIEGSYFIGTAAHYSASIRAIVGLQEALENTEQARKLPLSAAVDAWDGAVLIIEELLARSGEWSTLFPSAEYQALLREEGHLISCLKKVSVYERSSLKKIVPTHIDLHPHNILMPKDRSPVIVDIDSLQCADRTQSLAFAIFKLTRQYIVQEKPSDLSAPAQLFMNALGIQEGESRIYFMAAMAEVLRRISIIADLNMNKNNHDWNAILHLQLAALYELPYIFGQEK